MRSSSLKSLVTTVSIATLLTLAAPAHARPAQPRTGESIVRTIRMFVNRLLGGFTGNGLPSTPIPEDGTTTPPAGLPSTPIPTAPPVDPD